MPENSRNGYRPRSLKTAVGDVELEIPKLRHGTYYPDADLEGGDNSENE